jgi:2-polyprenyl-3-methyl-5-hydroxy-6-metoxy-1,4-benzoquinol methylase
MVGLELHTVLYSLLGKVAPLYDIALRYSGYEKSVHFFVSHFPFDKDAPLEVLDAGCGNGLYSLELLRRYKNARVTAFDMDKGFVENFQKKLFERGWSTRAEVFTDNITGELRRLKDKNFDLIITAGVLEYTPLKETVAHLAEFMRGGGYWFNSPIRTTPWGYIVGWLYGCAPYERKEYLATFEPTFTLEKIINLPSFRVYSFKEGQLFKKTS